jgi:NTP pyrophosphatase (non-canonical NTP hydrolase)
MKDLCLTDARIFEMIQEENCRQILKNGVQEATPFEWLAYLTEELGELSAAISEHHYRMGLATDVVDEAIQVATLSAKIAEMYLAVVNSAAAKEG